MWLDAVPESANFCIYLDDARLPPSSTRSCRSASTHCRPILTGRPGPGVGHLQPHRGNCWRSPTPGVCQRSSAIANARAGPASVTTSDAQRHLHLSAPRRRRRHQLDGVRNTDERSSSRWRCASRQESFALYCGDQPHSTCQGRFLQYSTDKGMRRFGTISNAAAGRSPSTSTTRPRGWN